jgi:hypothetical protein
MLKQNAPEVAQAWNAEGEGAQLGVFHTGEELLSRKTGEAGRYQALKRMYGFNPLEKLLQVASPKGYRSAYTASLKEQVASKKYSELAPCYLLSRWNGWRCRD